MEQLRLLRRDDRQLPEFPIGTDADDSGLGDTGMVQVIWGPNVDDYDMAGLTVGEVISELRTPFRLPPNVVVNVNGVEADANTRLTDGDELEFVRAAGEKGNA